MKRIFVLVLCFIFVFSLSSCGMRSAEQRYAKDCWRTVGSDDISLSKVCIMKYTSRLHLTGEVLDSPMYLEIPEYGYAILFHSYDSDEGFMDSYACFLNEDAELVFSFDYEEQHKLYEKHFENFSLFNLEDGEKALEYLGNCNYISEMINNADGEILKGNPASNTWYEFSARQIEWIQK